MLNDSSPQPLVERRPNKEPGEEEDEEDSSAKIAIPRKRLCDFCGDRQAILFCRPDSAKLCFSCDREVHSTNQLFTKHSRSLLCDSCDSSPASILCSTESLVLCQNCDWETHNRCASTIHERRPLEGFSGCPSANELLSIAGLDGDVGKKPLYLCDNDGLAESGRYGLSRTFDDVLSDVVVWDTPSIVTFDDLIFPGDSEHNFQAMGVPPLPKNRKATCGQHMDEIHCQLRELLRLEPGDIEQVNGFYSVVPQQDFQPGNVYTGCEHDAEAPEHPAFVAGASQWCSDSSEAANPVVFSEDAHKPSVIGSSLNECQTQDLNPTIADTLPPVLPKVSQHELKGPDRESAISRYKEKRKTRRFEKHIRYESRKVRAESRVRIKGRFAKTGWSCDMGNGRSN